MEKMSQNFLKNGETKRKTAHNPTKKKNGKPQTKPIFSELKKPIQIQNRKRNRRNTYY